MSNRDICEALESIERMLIQLLNANLGRIANALKKPNYFERKKHESEK